MQRGGSSPVIWVFSVSLFKHQLSLFTLSREKSLAWLHFERETDLIRERECVKYQKLLLPNLTQDGPEANNTKLETNSQKVLMPNKHSLAWLIANEGLIH